MYKRQVLTPWRVVNLHLSNMVGGYCFLNEQFDPQEVLEEPRLVDQGQVTEDIFLNPEARILEMNSKSGLYPLYMACLLYTSGLGIEAAFKLLAQLHTGGLLDMSVGVHQHIRTGVSCGPLHRLSLIHI